MNLPTIVNEVHKKKSLRSFSEKKLQQLVHALILKQTKAEERLLYRSALPDITRNVDLKEWLKAVTALANMNGGLIIYGIIARKNNAAQRIATTIGQNLKPTTLIKLKEAVADYSCPSFDKVELRTIVLKEPEKVAPKKTRPPKASSKRKKPKQPAKPKKLVLVKVTKYKEKTSYLSMAEYPPNFYLSISGVATPKKFSVRPIPA